MDGFIYFEYILILILFHKERDALQACYKE